MAKPKKIKIKEQIDTLCFDCGSVLELKLTLDQYNDDDFLENDGYNNVSFRVIHNREETDEEYNRRLGKIEKEKEKEKKNRLKVREKIIKEAKKLKIKPEELL